MTREEAIAYFKRHIELYCVEGICREAEEMAIKVLEQEPCEDCISREKLDKALYECFHEEDSPNNITEVRLGAVRNFVKSFPSANPQEPKTVHCKDCKWWKDSDGAYRRGVGAESQCPINRREVFEGSGYCYLFEPQESEDKE